MRSFRATHNLIAVSANAKETAINTEQTLDTSMLVDMSDVADLTPRRETNADELTGHEEPDTIYDLGATAELPMSFNKAQPQHFAFILGYGLGAVASATAGTGKQHTITPIANDLDSSRSIPCFTAAMRQGSTIAKRRFASMFVDSFSATFAKDDWVKLAARCLGTGKYASTISEESVTAAENATSLTLAANAVAGSDAAGRLDSVHRIRIYNLAGNAAWTEVVYSAASGATPAVISISAPGGTATTRTYKILYSPTEPAWASFPSRVVESPLRIAQMTLTLGGAWSGSAFVGGRAITAELSSLVWNFNNNMQIEFVPGAGGAYANRAFRPSRTQTISFNREFRDYILQNYIDQNETFGMYVLVEGAVYDTPHKYQVELIFPSLGLIKASHSVDGKINAEAGGWGRS